MNEWAKGYPSHAARLLAYIEQAKCNSDSPWAACCGDCPLKITHVHILTIDCGMTTIKEWLKGVEGAEA